MEQQILQADRKYRQVVLLALVLCLFFGVVLLQWGLPWAKLYLIQLPPRDALRVLQIATCLMFLSFVPVAWYAWSIGRKIVDSRRLPPPGVRLIKNVRLVEGAPAVARGRVVMFLAVVMAVVALASAVGLPWMMGLAMSQCASR